MHVSKSAFSKLFLALLSAWLLGAAAQAAPPLDAKYAFNIPPQPLATALLTFAEQAKTQVMTSSVDLKNLSCSGVSGEKTAKQALEQILRGSGLKYEVVAENAIAIQSPRKQTQGQSVPIAFRLTQASTVQTAQATVADSEEKAKTADKEESEILVLGSRIRRTDAGPSPVSVYDREYIDATGALTLADFLNRLPQNYAGISAGRGSSPNELNPEVGQRTETTSPAFNFVLGASAAPPGQTGVSGVSLRGLGSGSTLVLVDGRRVVQSGAGNRSTDSRQGFVDINTIPLAMVDHIEVITDGASALYGADAVAGVINIVMKKDWTGGELTTNHQGAFDGGGQERQASLSYGFKTGNLRGFFTAQAYDRDALKASDRDFTANQDHTGIVAGYNSVTGAPVYGRDFRLLYGYPGVIQAVSGNLNGITGPNGLPTRFATINPGVTGTPTLSDFTGALPGQTNGSQYITRGNTSKYIDLVPESTRYGISANFTLPIGEVMEAYANYGFNDIRGVSDTQPALTATGSNSFFGATDTRVLAAYNPFGQDIMVGMVHDEFGPIWQRTHTKAHSAVLGMRGAIGNTWRWDSGVSYQKQIFGQIQRAFNNPALTAALVNPDPAQRLNPFLDSSVAPSQAAIYERMAVYPTLNTESDLKSWDFNADGELFDLPGGAVRLAAGTFYERNTNESYATNYVAGLPPIPANTSARGARESYGAFSELSVPIFGRDRVFSGMRRLELQFAARYEDRDAAGTTTVPKIGFAWAPVESVLLRGNFSEGFRAPALTEYQVANTFGTQTLTDPLRNSVSTTGVLITRGSNPDVKPETSKTTYYGMILQPKWLQGSDLELNYYKTEQEDTIQSISAQRMVNNEAFFTDRVIRSAPTAADIAAGQPGALFAVDQTLVNFGRVINESLDIVMNYRLPTQALGNFRMSLTASHLLKSLQELAPNVPAVDDSGDTFAPPKWRYNVFAFWDHGPWNASAYFTYLSAFTTNRAGNTFTSSYPIPSQTNVDLRGGYTFGQGVWRGMGKGMRLSFGISNLLGEDPPFSDTVYGFNGALHSAMGRTYETQILLPF